MSDLKMGGAFVLLAAMANASFALPMKWMRRWAWENIWLLWSVASLLVFPLLVAYLTVPQLFAGYAEVAPEAIARVAFYGFAWGIAQVLFGLSVDKIGMALTFSIVLEHRRQWAQLFHSFDFTRSYCLLRWGDL